MGGPLPRLKQRLSDLAKGLRYEEAARLRDRIDALEHVIERLSRLQRLRATEACLIAPGIEAGWRTAFFIRGGTMCARRPLPRGADALVQIQAGLEVVQAAPDSTGPLSSQQAEDMPPCFRTLRNHDVSTHCLHFDRSVDILCLAHQKTARIFDRPDEWTGIAERQEKHIRAIGQR